MELILILILIGRITGYQYFIYRENIFFNEASFRKNKSKFKICQ